MPVVISATVLVIGLSAIAMGIRTWRSSKRLGLLGGAQVAFAVFFLLPESMAGWRYACVSLNAMFLLAITLTIKREVWRQVRSELFLFVATALALLASTLLTDVSRDMQIVLLVLAGALTATLIVTLLVRAAGFLRIARIAARAK